MKTLSDVKAGLLKDKATRDAYTVLEDEFSITHGNAWGNQRPVISISVFLDDRLDRARIYGNSKRAGS